MLMWKPFEILMLLEIFLDQMLWRARNKWKFLTLYLKCAISRKYWKYRKFGWRFFDSHSTKHLAKRKNEIGLTIYELKIEMWKKEHSTSKWNNNAKNREIIIQTVVVSIFRWLLNLRWKEKMKIYRYETDTAFLKTLAAAYQHRSLPP